VELWTIFFRTIFMYVFLLIMLRLMGKREIGKLSVFDLVVSFMIADMSVLVVENEKLPIIKGILPISTLVGLQIVVSYILLKSRKARKLIDGKPSIIIKNGKIQKKEMERTRYNLDDLMMQLREKNIANIGDVEFAFLETSGKLTVFPKEGKHPLMKEDYFNSHSLKPFSMPVPVIIDGAVQDEELESLGFNRFWLKKELKKKGYRRFKDVFFASADQQGKLYIQGKNSRD
jgi:uncharacterized membrane protein YcaP (DUF421 family)